MRVVSLFAGIGGFDVGLARAGMRTVAVVERDASCLKLLKDKFPDAVQFDDVRKVGSHNLPEFDLLCGGSPCQDVSVSGKRAGLKGERSGLFFELTRVIGECRPKWVAFENVPGLLSSNEGRDFERVLSEFEGLGYLYDVDVLDAQFFGVPQRRRRIFIICRRLDDLLLERTTSSACIISQCLTECLLGVLGVYLSRKDGSDERKFVDGLRKRMKLFGLCEGNRFSDLLTHLDAEFQKSARESGSWNTLPLSRIISDIVLAMETISTSPTTESRIFTCSKVVLDIARLMLNSDRSSPSFWAAAASSLTALKEYTKHAREASSNLFDGDQQVCDWRDFVGEALPVIESLGRVGIQNFGEIYPLSEGLRGNPKKGRKTREDVAGTLESRTAAGGFPGTDGACAGHVIPILEAGARTGKSTTDPRAGIGIGEDGDPMFTLQASKQHAIASDIIPFDTTQMTSKANRSAPKPGDPCHPLARQAHPPAIAFSSKDSGADASEDVSPTLRSMNFDKSHMNGGGQVAVAFKPSHFTRGKDGAPSEIVPPLTADADKGDQDPVIFQSRIARNGRGQPEGICPTLNGSNAGATSDMRPLVAAETMVRRLTPTECERLQGFPDGWTDGFSDSVRYRMLGNVVCVNVAEWLGKRIMKFSKEDWSTTAR